MHHGVGTREYPAHVSYQHQLGRHPGAKVRHVAMHWSVLRAVCNGIGGSIDIIWFLLLLVSLFMFGYAVRQLARVGYHSAWGCASNAFATLPMATCRSSLPRPQRGSRSTTAIPAISRRRFSAQKSIVAPTTTLPSHDAVVRA